MHEPACQRGVLLEQPEVLRRFALHAETGEPMPEALLEKVLAARRFNQGFATVEYTSSALVDLDLHLLPEVGDIDVLAFERTALERIGMPESIDDSYELMVEALDTAFTDWSVSR